MKMRYLAEVEVVKTWMLVKCTDCKVFGHSSRISLQRQVKAVLITSKVWKEKVKEVVEDAVVKKIQNDMVTRGG